MKNYFLAFVLAFLVVLTGLTLRHSVANATQSGSAGQNNLLAIGGSPTPPIPPAIGGSPTPPIPQTSAIGGSPTPPIPPAIGGSPTPPIPQ